MPLWTMLEQGVQLTQSSKRANGFDWLAQRFNDFARNYLLTKSTHTSRHFLQIRCFCSENSLDGLIRVRMQAAVALLVTVALFGGGPVKAPFVERCEVRAT